MSYDDYMKAQARYVSDNAMPIKLVNASKETPQNILMMKGLYKEFESDDAKCNTINDQFYFTEKMVNRLMHFAYLKGCNALDVKSYEEGWKSCYNDVLKKLGAESIL